jgi:hypothetical protein
MKFWMQSLTMKKFVLKFPDFIPGGICDAIIKRFENDDRKVEVFTYPIGNQSVTHMNGITMVL